MRASVTVARATVYVCVHMQKECVCVFVCVKEKMRMRTAVDASSSAKKDESASRNKERAGSTRQEKDKYHKSYVIAQVGNPACPGCRVARRKGRDAALLACHVVVAVE